jgi:hypothetical protein
MNRSSDAHRDWKPPAELAYARPRPVSLKFGGIAVIVLMVGLLVGSVVAGVLLSRSISERTQYDAKLQLAGVESDAVITGVELISGKSRRYRIAYTYDYGGRRYSARVTTSSRRAGELQAGAPIKVRFLPSDPEHSFAVDWESGPKPAWLIVLLPAGLIVPAIVLFFVMKRQRRLLEEGQPARAIVTGHTRTQHGKVVHYEYSVSGGGPVKGKSGPMHRTPEVDSVITVLYDPDNPRKSVAYPLSLYKIDTNR